MTKTNIRLVSRKSCTGCLNCFDSCPKKAISVRKDMFGFSYPKVIDKKCINCGKCLSICPIMNDVVRNQFTNVVYGGFSLDSSLREKSSSGGIFGELARSFFSVGGVVYGAAYDSNFYVRHLRVEREQEIDLLLGAKYIQSNLVGIFRQVREDLRNNKHVLFTGLPCQISALKLYLGNKISENLLCVDLVCHGVASPKVFQEYLFYIKCKEKKKSICYFTSRDKSDGWSYYSHSEKIVFNDKTVLITPNKRSLFFRLFGLNIILRKNCFNCHYKGLNRDSDLTLGDFWGIWEIDKSIDDNKGTSLIIVNSYKGKTFLESIKDKLIIKKYEILLPSKYNPAIYESVDGKRTFKRMTAKFALMVISLFFRN